MAKVEKVVRKIVGNAKAIISGTPIPLYAKWEQKPFNLSRLDAFFDLEYISSKSFNWRRRNPIRRVGSPMDS